jgi:hypothetical protein
MNSSPLDEPGHAQQGLRWTACWGGTCGARDAVRVPAVKRYPSQAALLTEPPRAGLDLAALAAAWPLLATARRGDGHPVLVLPGLMTGDPATLVLRTALRALGHHVSGWSLGTNRGPTGRVVHTLRTRDYSGRRGDPDISAGEFGEDVEGAAAVLGRGR